MVNKIIKIRVVLKVSHLKRKTHLAEYLQKKKKQEIQKNYNLCNIFELLRVIDKYLNYKYN